MSSQDPIVRRAELALDPLADARRLADGTWSATDTPEDAKALLRQADALERAQRMERWAADDERAEANTTRARQHQARAAELKSIGQRLRSSGEGHIHRGSELVVGREHERLPEGEYAAFRKAVNAAAADYGLERDLAELQEREERKAADIRVTESGPYEKGSPNSYIADVLVSADPELRGLVAGRSAGADMRPKAVEARLARHAKDVRRAVIGRTEYGRYVERMLREGSRREDADLHRSLASKQLREFRSGLLTTAGGLTASASGGGAAAFVPPAFLMDEWAAYRSPYAAFVGQCNSDVQLPAYGLEVYVPQVTAGTSVTTETELAGVSEGDSTTALLTAPVVLKSGQVTVTQQFLDRVGGIWHCWRCGVVYPAEGAAQCSSGQLRLLASARKCTKRHRLQRLRAHHGERCGRVVRGYQEGALEAHWYRGHQTPSYARVHAR